MLQNIFQKSGKAPVGLRWRSSVWYVTFGALHSTRTQIHCCSRLTQRTQWWDSVSTKFIFRAWTRPGSYLVSQVS